METTQQIRRELIMTNELYEKLYSNPTYRERLLEVLKCLFGSLTKRKHRLNRNKINNKDVK